MPTYIYIVWLIRKHFFLRKSHIKYFPICVIRRHKSLIMIKFTFCLLMYHTYIHEEEYRNLNTNIGYISSREQKMQLIFKPNLSCERFGKYGGNDAKKEELLTYFIEEFRNFCGIRKSYFSRKSSIQPYLESVECSPYPDKLFKLNFNISLFNPLYPHVRNGLLPSPHQYFVVLCVSRMYFNYVSGRAQMMTLCNVQFTSHYYVLFLMSKCSFLHLSSPAL